MAYKTERWYILALSIFENLIFGGIFYGWPAMVYVLKRQGYYYNLCTSNGTEISEVVSSDMSDKTCDDQDARLFLVYTIGVFCLQGTGLLGGYMYDRCGTRFTRIIINVLIFVGFLLMAVSTPETPWLLFPAAICLSIGGIEVLISTFQIGNLFGNRKATVITAINGVFDSSTVVMFLIKTVYDRGVDVTTILYILAGTTSIMLIQTFFLLPSDHIPWPLPANYRPRKYNKLKMEDPLKPITNGNIVQNGHPENGTMKNEIRVEEMDTVGQSLIENTKDKDYPSLVKCITSPTFIGLCLWAAALGLRNSFFLGTFNEWIKSLTNSNPEEESYYTSVFSALQCTGLFFAPFCGLVFDRNKKKRTGDVSPYADLMDSILPVLIVCTIFVIFSVMVLIPVLPFHYATFICQVILRAFFYATLATIIGIIFPLQYMGTLYGLCGLVAATVSLLQYLLVKIRQDIFDDNHQPLNIAFLFLMLLSYGFPLHLYLATRKREKKFLEKRSAGGELTLAT